MVRRHLKKIGLAILASLTIVSYSALIASAAWTGTDNFDSYAAGDLTGNSGGSGWSNNWSGSTAYDVETSVFQSSPNGVSVSGAGALKMDRSFTDISAGTASFSVYRTVNNSGDWYFYVESLAGAQIQVVFNSSGNITAYNSDTSSYETVQAYNVDTWYRIDVDFDDAAQDNKFRVRVECGAYTAYKSVYTTYTVINNLHFETASIGGTGYVDDVKDGSSCAAAATNYNNIIIFSVKYENTPTIKVV